MKIAVSKFKARCTKLLRDVEHNKKTLEITNRGKVVAIVGPAKAEKGPEPANFFGSLPGSISYIAEDFDEPLGDTEWEASRQ